MSGQGDLFGGTPSVVSPRAGRGEPTKTPPGRRGAQFVSEPATSAEEAKRRQLTEQLERFALAIGLEAGARGFAIWQVRDAATAAGVITGAEGQPDPITDRLAFPRALSWLGAVLPGMASAGLLERIIVDGRPQYDTSPGGRAHGNKNVLWRLTPEGRQLAETRTQPGTSGPSALVV